MKKTVKILGIATASATALLLLLAAVAVWFLFTPKRLTPKVRSVAAKYITCRHTIGDVELTFFSTFPQFGLQINGLYLINPVDGAPSDTLLATPKLTAKINLRSLIKNNAIELDEFQLNDLTASLFTDSSGNTNYNVFATDSTPTEKDTAAFKIPFEAITLNKVKINATRITYINRLSKMEAQVKTADATLSMNMKSHAGSGLLQASTPDFYFKKEDDVYARQLRLALEAPLYTDLDSMLLRLNNARFSVNQFNIHLDGSVALPPDGDIRTDITFDCTDAQIKPLLELVPPTYASMLEEIDTDGLLTITGKITGIYNDRRMPLVDLHFALREGLLTYSDYPTLHRINGNMDTHINPNDSLASYVRINHLQAKTGRSGMEISGKIGRLLADMLYDITVKANVHLPDVQPMLPSDMHIRLSGTMSGTAHAKFTWPQLRAMAVEQMNISGNMNFTTFNATYDSLFVETNKAHVAFRIPNTAAQHKETRFVAAGLTFDRLKYKQGNHLQAHLQAPRLKVETSNVVLDKRYLSALCEFTSDGLSASTNDISGILTHPSGKVFIRMDRADTIALPTMHADIQMEHLSGRMDTISTDMKRPALTLTVEGQAKDKSKPHIRVKYNSEELKAEMGNYAQAKTKRLTLAATGKYDSEQKNLLLQWEPDFNIHLQQGEITLASFPERIVVPTMDFNFNNRIFTINDSRILLGNSDFGLKGKVENMEAWMKNEGLLTGKLDFVSNVTDVNQIMALTNGWGNTDSIQVKATAPETPEKAPEAEPYMVPKGVDLTLHTHIKKAFVGEQIATALGGNLYVKDGTLVLEEVGFICEAAKMQLNATYKTPRKNHLYLGFIYHMVDIKIDELISMFPVVGEMIPMLTAFRGNAEFHVAAETYTDADYNIKPSTLRGACSIQGNDLVLLDGETFSKISKLLLFSKKTENKIDSLFAEMSLYKDEIDVYPLLLSMDKYQAALGGHHYLDMNFDYHISLLRPLRLGVDVKGSSDDLKIRLAKSRYAEDFKQKKEHAVETQSQRMRKIIRESLQLTTEIRK